MHLLILMLLNYKWLQIAEVVGVSTEEVMDFFKNQQVSTIEEYQRHDDEDNNITPMGKKF